MSKTTTIEPGTPDLADDFLGPVNPKTAARLLTQMESRERLGEIGQYPTLILYPSEWDLIKKLLRKEIKYANHN